MTGRGTPLTHEDAARFHMGTRENPMTITAVLLLAEPLAFEAFLPLIHQRLLAFPAFNERVVEGRLPFPQEPTRSKSW